MALNTENISRPGMEPQDGDWVRVTSGNTVIELQYHVPVPVPVTVLSRLAFMQRFTFSELTAIYTAAKTEVTVEVWLKLLEAAATVDLQHEQTIAGIDALVTAELLTQERADIILG